MESDQAPQPSDNFQVHHKFSVCMTWSVLRSCKNKISRDFQQISSGKRYPVMDNLNDNLFLKKDVPPT